MRNYNATTERCCDSFINNDVCSFIMSVIQNTRGVETLTSVIVIGKLVLMLLINFCCSRSIVFIVLRKLCFGQAYLWPLSNRLVRFKDIRRVPDNSPRTFVA